MYSLLNYLQDCATAHSESLGIGLEALGKEKRAWLLSSWQIEISRLPNYNEEVEVGTFPYDIKHFYGYRNLFIKDKSGEYLVKANSIWFFTDIEKLRPTRLPKEWAACYKSEPRLDMNYEGRKIALIEEEGNRKEKISVMHYHVDTNGHMNNACYVQLAAEYLPSDFLLGYLQVEYKKSVVYGEDIYPVVHEISDGIQVELYDVQGNCDAIVVFHRKEGDE
jgi:acyl-ACP thioesterase